MYSMKRTVTPDSRAHSASGRISPSFTLRWMTAFTFTGKPEGAGGLDAGQHTLDLGPHAIHAGEGLRVERVQAHRDPFQPRQGKCFGMMRQEHAIRGQGQVLDPRHRRNQGHEVFNAAAQEWFATGQAHLAHAQRRYRPDHRFDLLETQDLLAREELVARTKDIRRHAVTAAEVAPVRHRDPQVTKRPGEAVKGRRIHLEETINHRFH